MVIIEKNVKKWFLIDYYWYYYTARCVRFPLVPIKMNKGVTPPTTLADPTTLAYPIAWDKKLVELSKLWDERFRKEQERQSAMTKMALAKELGTKSGCRSIAPRDLEKLEQPLQNLGKPSKDTPECFAWVGSSAKLAEDPTQVFYLKDEEMLLAKILGHWKLYMLRDGKLERVFGLTCQKATVAEALWFLYYNELYTFVQRTPETDEERAYHSENGNLAGFQHPDLIERMGLSDAQIIKLKWATVTFFLFLY